MCEASPIPFYCSSPRSHHFRPLSSPPASCLRWEGGGPTHFSDCIYGILFVVLLYQMDIWRPPTVAIVSAASILIAFSIPVACCDGCKVSPNRGSFPPSSSSRCSAWQNLLPLPSFPQPSGSAPAPPPPSSFLPPSSCFHVSIWIYFVLAFVIVRVTLDLFAWAADLLIFFVGVNLCGFCLLIFVVILVCFFSSPPPFLLKHLWASFSPCPYGFPSFVVLQAFLWIWGLCLSAPLGRRHWSSAMESSFSSSLQARLLCP